MNPLTQRATERSRCETRLNYVIAIAAGIILGVMLGLAV